MYKLDVLVQGFPGRSTCHGALGWSTTTLLRGEGRAILVDAGAFGVRRLLRRQLDALGVAPEDITDVVLTHAHYDHAVNFTLFPQAAVWIGATELAWAVAQPPGFDPLPELYVQELSISTRVRRVADGEAFLPGFTAVASPGHTPGHLMFYVTGAASPVLFTGDAAKNRAELLTRTVHDPHDGATASATLDLIWDWWRRVPGTLLVPGHDLCMRLDDTGRPAYVGERRAAITAWFSESHEATLIDLGGGGQGARYST